MYARNPSIILQNMNFSRYYRYMAQLIYSFDLNIIDMELEFLYNFCKILKAACLLGIWGMKMRFLVGYMG